MRELEVVTAAVAADGLARAARRKGESGEADPGVKHANLHTECLNCGATLHGRYCQDCGQSDDDHHRSIFHLIWEAIEGLTHLDGRLMRTIPPLFLNPGKLAKDHFEGRRQRHVPPFRLFLITLLIFMFALELRTHHRAEAPGALKPGVTTSTTTSKAATPTPATPFSATTATPGVKTTTTGTTHGVTITRTDKGETTTVNVGGGVLKIGAGPPQTANPADIDKGFDEMSKSKKPALRWLGEHARKANTNREYFRSIMFEWGHRLSILLLPIFAGMLAFCYFYKRQFYVYDHLVVAMHFLSFVFLIWAVAYLIPDPAGGFVVLAATIWTPVNLFMTLRGAYGSSILGAGLKTFFLWTVTLSLFVTLLLGVIFIAIGSM